MARTVQGKPVADPIERLKGKMEGLHFLFDGERLKQLIQQASQQHNREKEYDRMNPETIAWWEQWCEEVANAKRSANAV